MRRSSPRPLDRRAANAASARLLGTVVAVVSLGGCPRPSTVEPPRGVKHSPIAPKDEVATEASDLPGALAALRNLQTIPELWNAQNQAQDHLGQALARLEEPTSYRVTTVPQPRPPPEGPRPGKAVPSQAPRERWAGRGAQPGVCQEACRHVAAICYASQRICHIAGRLGDWAARQACTRAGERCQEARLAVAARCARCPGT